MKIGDLAKRCGVPASTLRFYESKGLLKSIPRKLNGYREYPEDAVLLLSVIIAAQKTGFSLDEIQQMLPSQVTDWNHEALTLSLRKKIEDIEAMEKQLKQNKSTLKNVLKAIEQKPAEVGCEDNAKRVMKNLGKTTKKAKVSRSQ